MPKLSAGVGLARSLLVYYGMPWRRRGLSRLYSGLVETGDLVFDIGAHVGNRSRTLHALGARVVAVEPQPLLIRTLARTLPKTRVTLVTKAVGRAPGRATLRISSRHPTVSTLSSDWIGKVGATKGFGAVSWDREAEVEVTTLDALIAEHGKPAFCKIDVEGLEAEILAGLSQPLALVAFEALPEAQEVTRACLERLAELGEYRFNLVEGEGARFLSHDWVDAPAILKIAGAMERSGDIYARLRR